MEDGRSMTVGFVIVGLPSSIKFDSVAPSEYKNTVSLFAGWGVNFVGISLNECV